MDTSVKLKGSTLIEVLIAMVILAIVFLMGSHVYLRSMDQGANMRQLMAGCEIRSKLFEAEDQKTWFDESWEGEAFGIHKKVLPVGDSEDLIQINLSAVDPSGYVIANLNKMVLIDE